MHTVTSKQSEHEIEAAHYFDSIQWYKKIFTNDELSAILAASCLRYLGGRTDVDFVLYISEAIREKYQNQVNPQMRKAVEILHLLFNDLKNNTVAVGDNKKIYTIVNKAQKILTKKEYIK